LLVIVPILWYVFVNECSIKEAFSRLKLRLERIDMAFLWGLLAAIIIFIVIFVLQFILMRIGYQAEDLSNIPDIRKLFSWPTMFFLVGIQPIAEEFFFRGFLFEKIEKSAGGVIAIVATAFLFGLAHMSYGKLFPVVMPILIGIILGYIVYRTKNLYSSIIAHVVFNVTVLTIAYVGAELIKDLALIL
jgi:membrane protease YdiL (CAAX protease family)